MTELTLEELDEWRELPPGELTPIEYAALIKAACAHLEDRATIAERDASIGRLQKRYADVSMQHGESRARVEQLEGALSACIRDWGREVYDRSITPEHLPEALKLARVALARTE